MLGERGRNFDYTRWVTGALVSSLLGLIPTLQRLRPHVVLSSLPGSYLLASSVAVRIYTAACGSDLLIPEEV